WLNTQTMEREANQFAAELLMPDAVCLKLFNQYSQQSKVTSAAVARQMATDLFVSFDAMRWRLNELDLWQPRDK
ncbi:MAG TPA: ImmA/IrrE family metallo-endopeptidase, partial [Blastocatellia bacterium]|nr:ImmA/IrrE family metallo-endopeptidase [Blastocatellia bacterium]